MNPDDCIYLDEAQLLGFGESDTTGPWIKLRLPDAERLTAFRGRKGESLHVAIASTDPIEVAKRKPRPGPYGAVYSCLHRANLFSPSSPLVRACGTDADYLQWLRDCTCAHCDAPPPSEPAHVRRVSHGAGTGIKPSYSAIALCHACHGLQHQKGEEAIGGRQWVDRQASQHLATWCHRQIAGEIGYPGLSHVPPKEFAKWWEAKVELPLPRDIGEELRDV